MCPRRKSTNIVEGRTQDHAFRPPEFEPTNLQRQVGQSPETNQDEEPDDQIAGRTILHALFPSTSFFFTCCDKTPQSAVII